MLNKRLGKAAAAEVLLKNPVSDPSNYRARRCARCVEQLEPPPRVCQGVLVCSPESLDKQSNEDIVDAANLVETLENNKPIINAIAGVVWFGILGAFAYRIGTAGGCPPGSIC